MLTRLARTLAVLAAAVFMLTAFPVSAQDARGTIVGRVTDHVDDLGAVHFEMKRLLVVFDGILNKEGSQIDGQFKQATASYALSLKRVARPTSLNRPQEPKPPYPYAEEEGEGGDGARAVVSRLHPHTGNAWSVGITGAPVGGKSKVSQGYKGGEGKGD